MKTLEAGTTKFNACGRSWGCSFGPGGLLFELRSSDADSAIAVYERDGGLARRVALGDARHFAVLPDASIVCAHGEELQINGASHCVGDTVQALCAGPDGRFAVLTEGRLQIWRGSTREVDVEAHSKDGWSVDWVGDRIATGGWDHRAMLWNADGERLGEVSTNNVRSVCLADGFLYTGGGSGRVRRWRLDDLSEVGPPLHHEFSPGGGDAGVQSLCVRGGDVFTWANDLRVRCWRDGKELWRVPVSERHKGTMALAMGEDRLALSHGYGPMVVLDFDGKLLSERGVPNGVYGLEQGAELELRGREFTQWWKGGALVGSAEGGTTGRLVLNNDRALPLDENHRDPGRPKTDPPTSGVVIVASCGSALAVVDNANIEIVDGGFERRISPGGAGGVAFGPTGEWLVTAQQGGISWYWLRPVQQLALRSGEDREYTNIAVSPDGATVAAVRACYIEMYATQDGAKLGEAPLEDAGSLRFVGARTVLAASRSGLYRWTAGEPLEAVFTFEHPSERYIEWQFKWPLDVHEGRAVFVGDDTNVWSVAVEMEQDSAPRVEPPGRPEPLDFSTTVWCFSGTFGQIHKDAAAARVVALGGKVAKSVTKKCTHLVVSYGSSPLAARKVGSQEKKAIAAGVPVLSEADFLYNAAPSADELRAWDVATFNAWRSARPSAGMHRPLLIRALRGIEWPGAQLSGADLRYADLTGANLEGADLSNIEGERLSLRGANLRGANLSGAKLYRAELHGADLTGANIEGTDFRCAFR